MPFVDTEEARIALNDYIYKDVNACPECRPDAVCDAHYRQFWQEFQLTNKLWQILDDLARPVLLNGADETLSDKEPVWAIRIGKDKSFWESTAGDVRISASKFPDYTYKMARRVIQSPPPVPQEPRK